MHNIDGRPLFPAQATKQKRGKISIDLITSNSISFSLSGFFFLRCLSLYIYTYIYLYCSYNVWDGNRIRCDQVQRAAGSADPLGIRYFVSILYIVIHCLGTYDGNVAPPWWPSTPSGKVSGTVAHLGGRYSPETSMKGYTNGNLAPLWWPFIIIISLTGCIRFRTN